MLWVVFIALLSVAAATYSSDKWRLESFCANGIMKNGRCYKALQAGQLPGNDWRNQYLSLSPSNSEPMMMASSIKGYCGANKAMYYVQSLPNLKDTFYTTDEVEYNEVISSNKFYKGMDHGVAFYVW
ncbi:hypothetical protein QR680_016123 [Steinernema hermaphroditum]|uniref:SCP domain-containing protein n=1 Tax=Steinernema hermaphroditum TaxID=289476 RepID=A0AA39LLX3_9BILA|nr:hypothetical protein QR680_016123 [Steinernema hermaphroditum]